MNAHLQRALVLMDQSRFELAVQELHQALSDEPNDALVQANLALCFVELEKYKEATRLAELAITSAPDWPHAHYVLAQVYTARNRPEKARDAIEEALRLDPEVPTYHAALAGIHLEEGRWQAALKVAEAGLAHDAQHVGCNNLRAMALTRLGRQAEAAFTLESSLEEDPEVAVTHENIGWNHLHAGKPTLALESFSEALRLDPDAESAKAGLLEAMKARYFFYSLVLRYFLWMERIGEKAQWIFIIGLFMGQRVVLELTRTHPHWRPWLEPLLTLYLVFVIISWLADPLFNLFMFLNKYGRHALSRDQRHGALWVGLFTVPALICLALWLYTKHELAALGGIYFGMMLLPISSIYQCDRGWPRWLMTLVTLLLASFVPAIFLLPAAARPPVNVLIQAVVVSCMLSTWVANFLMLAKVRK